MIDALALVIEHGYMAIALGDWTVFHNRDSIAEYPLIRDATGQFDVWFTIDPHIIKAVGNRTVVDENITTGITPEVSIE